jgi:hypothetical protein
MRYREPRIKAASIIIMVIVILWWHYFSLPGKAGYPGNTLAEIIALTCFGSSYLEERGSCTGHNGGVASFKLQII